MMFALLRKPLLLSSTALLSLTLLPAIVSGISLPLSSSIISVAYADDDGGDDHGGNDHGDDSGNDSSDDSGGDDDSRDDASDDDSDNDVSDDDKTDDRDIHDDQTSNRRDRNVETSLVVNETQLRGLTNGTMIAVDQNGRQLRVEIEQERGMTEVKFAAPRGTVTRVTVVPVN
ncbi:hypothetical protein NBH19_13005 [Rhizobium sp. S95]|uniref:Uncharacterized protein n=1 Tax=Ciceribacter sichuanensis TaxID=2949647 RepID=A0AAJ1BXW3_9HYPH|nr:MULTISPECIES: hypothetical protein [unclassified Ciceribacter]MCM2396991.1 hypothetical protein [Ciceribacter sp. S95]MCO5957917.1 hypothetical protein [Ciceribacter sp. S101]